MVEAKVKRGYLLKTSVGFDIQIDADEIPKALQAHKSEKLAKFKRGFVSGRFIAGIVEDRERIVVEERFKNGKRYEEVRLLKDIFQGMELEKLVGGEQPKQLTSAEDN